MELPAHVTPRDLLPGDVVALDAGDTRQLHRLESVSAGELWGCDWGDGRHSLLDASRVVVLIHRPNVRVPGRQAPAKLEGDADTEAGRPDGTPTA